MAAAAPINVAAAQKAALPFVNEFLTFVNAAVTPFHATQLISKMLSDAGFQQIKEDTRETLRTPLGKYFITRNQSSIIAISVGGKYQAGNGIKIVGAHTDSPNIGLRPKTKNNKSEHIGVGVQLYGGGLWHTWFDRELTVAGRVICQTAPSAPLVSKFVHIKKPILRIPNLAIHLTDAKEREAFSPHKENNIAPILATELMTKALGQELETANGQCGPLFAAIAKELGLGSTNEIVDFDLSIVDTQPACLTGLYDEFVASPRLDNLVSCFAAVKALIRASDTMENETMIRMVSLFDHEEVGSCSSPGAGGSLLPDIIDRITSGLESAERAALVSKSFSLSVDNAHGLHPNYADRHNNAHRPLIHNGPVVKYNSNQRYATSGATSAILLALGKKVGVPLQQFCVKNDSPCGSTIGPITSTLTGIATVDLGIPQLAMHSIRESCGTVDIWYLEKLLKGYFDESADLLQVREE